MDEKLQILFPLFKKESFPIISSGVFEFQVVSKKRIYFRNCGDKYWRVCNILKSKSGWNLSRFHNLPQKQTEDICHFLNKNVTTEILNRAEKVRLNNLVCSYYQKFEQTQRTLERVEEKLEKSYDRLRKMTQ